MTYAETIEYLYNTAPMFQNIGAAAYKDDLENTRALNAILDEPYRAFRSVHIAGTNGKGSVSQMLYSVLREAGYRTGLYTSPHLKDFRERMVADGEMISQEEVTAFVERMKPHIEALKPSFFEITTVMAFDFFRRRGVDIAVIETGMGGRLDCTNVITPLLSVITNVSLDHTQYLGDSLPKIAAEKAGIIKPEVPVAVGEHSPETAPTFIARAKELWAPLRFADQTYRCPGHEGRCYEIVNLLDNDRFTLELGMEGDYQQKNLCTALAALDLLSEKLPEPLEPDTVRRGLSKARVRGRWETISTDPCPVICDTGHNEAGIRSVARQLERQSYEKLWFVLGMVQDKDLPKILELLPREAYYIFTRADIPRALDAGELAEAARRAGLSGEVAGSVPEALAKARELAGPGDLIFVGGSTFTVAEVL